MVTKQRAFFVVALILLGLGTIGAPRCDGGEIRRDARKMCDLNGKVFADKRSEPPNTPAPGSLHGQIFCGDGTRITHKASPCHLSPIIGINTPQQDSKGNYLRDREGKIIHHFTSRPSRASRICASRQERKTRGEWPPPSKSIAQVIGEARHAAACARMQRLIAQGVIGGPTPVWCGEDPYVPGFREGCIEQCKKREGVAYWEEPVICACQDFTEFHLSCHRSPELLQGIPDFSCKVKGQRAFAADVIELEISAPNL